MHKVFKTSKTLKLASVLLTGALFLLCTATATSTSCLASADRQAFAGLGIGAEVFSQEGSGTGFYYQGFAGYNFDAAWGFGLHAGSSKIGDIHARVTDFGVFGQYTDQTSGLYGRVYLDGVSASIDGGGRVHGVNGSQTGVAPGVGLGMYIPSAGSFHMTPELTYRAAVLDKVVNLVAIAFNLTWDF